MVEKSFRLFVARHFFGLCFSIPDFFSVFLDSKDSFEMLVWIMSSRFLDFGGGTTFWDAEDLGIF